MEQRILDSPQLHNLAVSLSCLELDPVQHIVQWEELKTVILRLPGLRLLSIDVHPDLKMSSKSGIACDTLPASLCVVDDQGLLPISRAQLKNRFRYGGDIDTDMVPNEFQLPLIPGENLPALDSLEIRARAYRLDSMHCKQLLQSLDVTKLKRLRIGPSDPVDFFKVFQGQLKQLECLDFAYTYIHQYWSPHARYQSKHLACAKFITSIRALKELVVRTDGINLEEHFWSVIAEVHGTHLRHFSIRTPYDGLEPPECKGDLGSLLCCLSSLTSLDLALRPCPSAGDKCDDCFVEMHSMVHHMQDEPLPAPVTNNVLEHQLYRRDSSHTNTPNPTRLNPRLSTRAADFVRTYRQPRPLRHPQNMGQIHLGASPKRITSLHDGVLALGVRLSTSRRVPSTETRTYQSTRL